MGRMLVRARRGSTALLTAPNRETHGIAPVGLPRHREGWVQQSAGAPTSRTVALTEPTNAHSYERRGGARAFGAKNEARRKVRRACDS